MKEIKCLNSNFLKGFLKEAALGEKSLKPLSSSGKMVGNKPSSMVSTVAAYKPSPIPTSKPSSPSNNLSTNLPTSGKINKNVKPKSTKTSPGGMHI